MTFLWSTSFVLVKEGLALRGEVGRTLRRLTHRQWAELGLLGLLLYAVTQGAIFIGLQELPAVTVNLLLNLTSPLVAGLAIFTLGEKPTVLQWAGIALFALGALVCFYPPRLADEAVGALAAVILGVAANAGSVVLGRGVNHQQSLHTLAITAVSMAVGAGALLVAGAALQGVPALEARHWAVVIWLAVVNTAFAFTIWDQTLRTLSAAESSILNGTMLVQVAVLAWLFLNERLTSRQGLGMVSAGAGAVVVAVQASGARPRGRGKARA